MRVSLPVLDLTGPSPCSATNRLDTRQRCGQRLKYCSDWNEKASVLGSVKHEPLARRPAALLDLPCARLPGIAQVGTAGSVAFRSNNRIIMLPCSGVSRPIVDWAAEAEPGEAPAGVIACDELAHCRPDFGGGAKDSAEDRLVVQGAEKSLADSVRLGLVREGMTERHAPVGDSGE